MKFLTIIIMLSLLLSACGSRVHSVSLPQAYGPGTYAVYTSCRSASKAQAAALEKGTVFCKDRGEILAPQSSGLVARGQFRFIFSCQPDTTVNFEGDKPPMQTKTEKKD